MLRPLVRPHVAPLAQLLVFAFALTGCASASTSACPTLPTSQAPSLSGTYVIASITGEDGQTLTSDDIFRALAADGVRFSLTFDDGEVGVELLLIDEVSAEVSSVTSHRLFVVSACSARTPGIWTEDGFVLPDDLHAVGTAAAIAVDRTHESDGATRTATHSDRQRCTASLDAGTFVIAERGPLDDDGRPSTVTLRYGENQRAVMTLEAVVPLADVDVVGFAVESAQLEDRDAQGE